MKEPHIVLFNPDQWRSDVLGHLGNPAAVTPHLDRIVREDGVSFSHAFCQNTVCTPSRCSFMTGWYPHVMGHRTMHHMIHTEQGEPLLLSELRNAGYHVSWLGKNDLTPGDRERTDFVDNIGDRARYGALDPHWHGPVYEAARGRPGDDTYYSFQVGRLAKREGEAFYHDYDWLCVMEAVRQIRERPADKPLCLYLPLIYPHPPYACEEPWFSAIDRSALPRRVAAPADWDAAGKPSILRELHRRFGMQGWTEERWTELRATYYAMCARTDALFGVLVDALKDAGLYDDTAIFVFSDHGDFTGDYGLVEKTQNTFEDCLSRVPLIVKPPVGVACQPGVRDTLTELVDVSETVYALAGIDPGYDRFGRSLLPSLANPAAFHRDAVFCEGGRRVGEPQAAELESVQKRSDRPFECNPYWPRVSLQVMIDEPYHTKAAMCRTHDFKYVRRLYEKDELYNLRADPRETCNVVDDPAYAAPLAALRERLLTWYQETCDVVPRQTDPR